MTRLLADSTNLNDIPTGVFALIGYYGDGDFAASAAQIERHRAAGSVMAAITVGRNPTTEPIADSETGDYLPWETVDFCIAKRGQGIDPSVYVSYDLWAPTQTEFRLRGVAEPHWWVALWDGVMVVIPGSVASQRRNPTYTGAHYDESIVADFWPGVDGTFGPGGGSTGGNMATKQDIVSAIQDTGLEGGVTSIYNQLVAIESAIKAIPSGGSVPDPALVTAVQQLTATVQALSKHLGVGTL